MTPSSNSNNDTQKIRSTNWSGSIPIVLSLAPTSLSAPTMPPPLHKMVSRMTYLHIGLENEVKKMYKFAPAALLLKGKGVVGVGGKNAIRSKMEPPDDPPHDDAKNKEKENDNKSDDALDKSEKKKDEGNANNQDDDDDDEEEDIENSYPICWFEDEDTGIALRWHLFVGVLFDLLVRRRRRHNERHQSYSELNNESDSETKLEKSEEKDGDITSQPLDLPWKIRVHFTSYPTSQILQFDDHDSTSSSSGTVLTTVQRFYHHSLKQSLSLQHGSPKVALNMTKANHETYWEALVRCNYDLYQQVNSGLQVSAAAAPVAASGGSDVEEGNEKKNEEGKGENSCVNGGSNSDVVKKVKRPWDNLMYVPVRLLVDGNPPIQRPFGVYMEYDENESTDAEDKDEAGETNIGNGTYTSLGDLLLEWVPNLFHREGADATVAPIKSLTWSIQGIQPPLSCPIVDLWQCLCYPDHFLYITIDTNTL